MNLREKNVTNWLFQLVILICHATVALLSIKTLHVSCNSSSAVIDAFANLHCAICLRWAHETFETSRIRTFLTSTTKLKHFNACHYCSSMRISWICRTCSIVHRYFFS
ncbi:unnamed protein product [Albugo candida]|uniref:Uncharacterized protein n=1 Tax=Albugo candida TaxID=65357 RepID=A0A024G5P3_9STRA|nr:unnamed protein product [Albugo candida]|eukprot:CCI41858.1 unnamed protein product [Albugo candida]